MLPLTPQVLSQKKNVSITTNIWSSQSTYNKSKETSQNYDIHKKGLDNTAFLTYGFNSDHLDDSSILDVFKNYCFFESDTNRKCRNKKICHLSRKTKGTVLNKHLFLHMTQLLPKNE